MMYPVLAKVRYEELGRENHDGVSDRAFFGVSLFLSWVIGPLLMFTLAWLLLPNQPAYRTGVIIVGLARCIAMVLIWNDLAKGDRDRAAMLVVFNAIFQVAAFSLLGYFYLTVLPGWLGLDTQGFQPGIWEIARTVLIFLGIPLTAGFLTRRIGLKRKGRDWYEHRFIPRISPITLYGLLFTIVLLFAIQGDTITSQPLDVAMIALPLLAYFVVMWIAGFAIGKLIGLPYPQTASLAFTVASNDFELAIAVAVGVFGATSGQALAGVVGPLIEVPVLVSSSTSRSGHGGSGATAICGSDRSRAPRRDPPPRTTTTARLDCVLEETILRSVSSERLRALAQASGFRATARATLRS